MAAPEDSVAAGHDEVDRIVAAWRRERPDLDVAPIEVFSRVSRLARLLDLARRSSFGVSELETWEFDVLSALRRSGAPYRLSPGALVTQTLVTSGTMTNRIDRLADRGLVRRLPMPGDRRSVLVELSDSGLDAVDRVQAGIAELDQDTASIAGHRQPAHQASVGEAVDPIRHGAASHERLGDERARREPVRGA